MRYEHSATLATQAAANAFDAGAGPPTCPLTGLGLTPAPPVPNSLFGTPRTMLNPRPFSSLRSSRSRLPRAASRHVGPRSTNEDIRSKTGKISTRIEWVRAAAG